MTDLEKRRKQVEGTATFGLILIAVALVSPLTTPSSTEYLSVFRWIYGAGALIYLISRIVGVSDPEGSLRLRRLRRMQCWAGVAFGIATAFWFIGQHRLGDSAGAGAVLWNTIMFTLVGAVIQIISTWLIYSQSKKENIQVNKEKGDKPRS